METEKMISFINHYNNNLIDESEDGISFQFYKSQFKILKYLIVLCRINNFSFQIHKEDVKDCERIYLINISF